VDLSWSYKLEIIVAPKQKDGSKVAMNASLAKLDYLIVIKNDLYSLILALSTWYLRIHPNPALSIEDRTAIESDHDRFSEFDGPWIIHKNSNKPSDIDINIDYKTMDSDWAVSLPKKQLATRPEELFGYFDSVVAKFAVVVQFRKGLIPTPITKEGFTEIHPFKGPEGCNQKGRCFFLDAESILNPLTANWA
jgi:hypothetical protein